jgi:hypothetical protein
VLKIVGWVERSETHHISAQMNRWVSLRSTHPTYWSRPAVASRFQQCKDASARVQVEGDRLACYTNDERMLTGKLRLLAVGDLDNARTCFGHAVDYRIQR